MQETNINNWSRPGIPHHLRIMDTELKKVEATVTHQKKEEKIISSFKHRFSDAVWYNWLKGKDVMILGVGGIGSWIAMCLSRIGCIVHIYDMDTVESHNLGGQLYSLEHVGVSKTDATKRICHSFSGGEANVVTNGKFKPTSPINPIVISAFDNMAGRRLAFEKWAEALQEDQENAAEYLFIDGRLLAEEYQVYGVTQGRLDDYKKTLFSDNEVAEASCSLKSTTHCSMSIGADIVAILTNFAANRVYKDDIRIVPYSIEKSIMSFTYDVKTESDEQRKENTGHI